MALASGVGKVIVYAKESAWGTKAAAGSGKYLRRVTCDLGLEREQFESKEIVSTAQTTDSRSGTDNVSGTLSGEMSPGSYDDFWASLLRGAWVAGVTTTATTIAAVAATSKLTRSSGSWITDGFKLGDLVSVSGFTDPDNAVRGVITAITATDLTLNATLVDEAAGDSVTVAVAGNKLSVPLLAASRTDDSYTVESFHTDTSESYLATGVKVGSASVKIDPNAISTVEFSLMGKDVIPATSAYFTTPAAASTTGVLSGNAGAIYIDGVQAAVITTASFEVNGNMEVGNVVGNEQPDGTRPAAAIFLGRVTASGELSAYVTGNTLFTKARSETPVELVFQYKGEGNQAMVFKFPKCKLSIPKRDDKEVGGLIDSMSFTALLDAVGTTTTEQSTVVIQSVTA